MGDKLVFTKKRSVFPMKMKDKKIELYTAENIDACPWPQTEEGVYARRFLEPLVKKGVGHYVDNIDTKMGVLIVDDTAFPVTINDGQYANAFVCSPFSHYVSYAGITVEKIKNRFIKKAINASLKIYELLMKKGKINQVITVNNWLFTTNLSPKMTPEALKKINEYLKASFPTHAILFRSITKQTCAEGYHALKSNGYHLIASRYMYLLDGTNDSVFQTRIFKSDLKFFRESAFKIVPPDEIEEADISRLQELYNALYIQKYSTLNPQFNTHFFKHLINNQLLQIHAVKEDDSYIGLVGYFCRNKQMISPLFGYDPNDEKKGVYRYLSTILILEAQKHQAIFNQSAGGSFYKKIRRATGEMEYTAVYTKHLPVYRKLPWMILKMAINTLGKRYMKKY